MGTGAASTFTEEEARALLAGAEAAVSAARPRDVAAFLAAHFAGVAERRRREGGGAEPEAPAEDADKLAPEQCWAADASGLVLAVPVEAPEAAPAYASLAVSAAALRGWVAQPSPCCCAAALAGAWNATLPNGRQETTALRTPDALAALRAVLQRQKTAKEERLQRLLGGAVLAPLEGAVVERVARECDGRTLGGKAEAGVRRAELRGFLRALAEERGAPLPEPTDGGEVPGEGGDPADAMEMEPPDVFTALRGLFAELPEEAAAPPPEADDGDEELLDAGDDKANGDKGGAAGVLKELEDLFLKKVGGLEKLDRDRPSTGAFGNWGIVQGASSLTAERGGGLRVRTFMAKLKKAEVPLSTRDGEEAAVAQWGRLREALARDDTALVYHLRNHYAMVFALRERREPGGAWTREVLTARKGQRPTAWISWDEVRDTLLRWAGHAILAVTRDAAPDPLGGAGPPEGGTA